MQKIKIAEANLAWTKPVQADNFVVYIIIMGVQYGKHKS